jgi:hypothetical protein
LRGPKRRTCLCLSALFWARCPERFSCRADGHRTRPPRPLAKIRERSVCVVTPS